MKLRLLGVVTVCFLGVTFEVNADGLPANPWTNRTETAIQPSRQINVNYENEAPLDYPDAVILPSTPRRNAGGVGKISAPVRPRRTTSSDSNATSSDWTDWFSSDETESQSQMPEVSSSSIVNSETNMDVTAEYENLKRQGLTKWNNATAPIRNYYNKWRKMLQEASEMNVKDFMP